MNMMEKETSDVLASELQDAFKLPRTAYEAVDMLIEQAPLKDRTTIANMNPDELVTLKTTIGEYIENKVQAQIRKR